MIGSFVIATLMSLALLYFYYDIQSLRALQALYNHIDMHERKIAKVKGYVYIPRRRIIY